MNLLSTSDIDKAHLILQPFITQTPLVTNEAINTLVNATVYFKLENLQKTGSFKIRGATYKNLSSFRRTKTKGNSCLFFW